MNARLFQAADWTKAYTAAKEMPSIMRKILMEVRKDSSI
jgi:hypothetical protein